MTCLELNFYKKNFLRITLDFGDIDSKGRHICKDPEGTPASPNSLL